MDKWFLLLTHRNCLRVPRWQGFPVSPKVLLRKSLSPLRGRVYHIHPLYSRTTSARFLKISSASCAPFSHGIPLFTFGSAVTIVNMLAFRIRRMPPVASDRRYQLFNDQGELALIADYGSPWLPRAVPNQVRFALCDGRAVATLDLPQDFEQRAGPASYAVIFDYAVHAIINEVSPSSTRSLAGGPFFTLEAGGKAWLVLPRDGQQAGYALYRSPGGYSRNLDPDLAAISDPIGSIDSGAGRFDFVAELPLGELEQGEIVILALVFLMDGAAPGQNTGERPQR